MGKIKDFARNCYIGLAGNRVTLGARLNTVAGIGAATLLGLDAGVQEFAEVYAFLSFQAQAVIEGLTSLGLTSLKNYRAASKHIGKHGKLDRRFLETILGCEKNDRLTGYCQLQGAYFAAKENGLVDEFRKLKGEVSRNVLPNF